MEYKTDFHKLTEQLDKKPVNPDRLVSEHSSKKTVQLFEFLKSIYGRKILAGQQYLQREELEDIVYFRASGRIPAIRGYDLMDMDKKKGDNQIKRAIEWAKNSGCIITMCWHWYAPDNMSDTENTVWSFYYKTTDYSSKTSFDITKAVTEGTPEYDFAVSRIDKAAENLREFEKADIPVLWRPLHEADGNWFWWGNRGAESVEAYKKLWYMIFDRFENYHKLTNLIWVWNGQSRTMAVNPNTFDICGEDIYSAVENDHTSQKAKFDEVTSYTYGKMAALSECGYIPHPKNLVKDGVKWLWWLPWWGSFVYKTEGWRPYLDEHKLPLPNEKYFSAELLTEMLDDEYCLTLDKLPWFTEENRRYVEKRLEKRESK